MVVELSSFTLLFKCCNSCYYSNAAKSVRSKKVKKNSPFSSRKTDLSTIKQYQNNMKFEGNCPCGCAVLSLANQGRNVSMGEKGLLSVSRYF